MKRILMPFQFTDSKFDKFYMTFNALTKKFHPYHCSTKGLLAKGISTEYSTIQGAGTHM